MAYFNKILVANRGEIAIRVMRSCREFGIESVGIYSDADKNAFHVNYADEAFCVGEAPPTKSYLNIDRIIHIAKTADVDAIHPGYGFLSENAAFARRCEEEGITFIGPSSRTIGMMGTKVGSRDLMKAAGVPILPGTPGAVTDIDEAIRIAEQIGYPVIIKASAGGGGIGMQVVEHPDMIEEAVTGAMRIAASAFGDSAVFIEKYLTRPRHIEVQLLCDTHGNRIHLFERECSIQRRHQKLIEEAPSPIMDEATRERITTAALKVAEACDYVNAGTVEFLYSKGEFYFMEMNTRLQVEHTVTELVTGVDIVGQQIIIASGKEMTYSQDDITLRGHAIECRVNAEDPLNDFAADPGKITLYRSPGGPGIRIDSGVYQGYTIPPNYDSMIAKLCSWGMTREHAIGRMRRAIYEYVVGGVKTTLPLHHAIMHHPYFIDGDTHTHFLQEEDVQRTLKRYIMEEEVRMSHLATPLRDGKKVAAAIAGVTAVIAKNQ